MAQSTKRWLPRFSLRTLLLSWLVLGVGTAWVSHNYSEYRIEQGLIEALAKNTPPGSLMAVATNGVTTCLVGSYVM